MTETSRETTSTQPGQARVERWPWWTTAWHGRIYRPVMQLMHRLGWCYPRQMPHAEGESYRPGYYRVWCHWCGIRGSVISTREIVFDFSQTYDTRDASTGRKGQ